MRLNSWNLSKQCSPKRESDPWKNSVYCRDINPSSNIITDWDLLLGCCSNFIKITITKEESKNSSSKKTIGSHIFEYIKKFSNHGIYSPKDGKIGGKCNKLNSDDKNGKFYINKVI